MDLIIAVEDPNARDVRALLDRRGVPALCAVRGVHGQSLQRVYDSFARPPVIRHVRPPT